MNHLLPQPEQERDSDGARAFARAWDTFYAQFQQTGLLDDLEKANENMRRALSLTSDGHPDKPTFLNNLGLSLKDRFRRTGTLSNLEEAIESQRGAISLTPDDHPSKPGYLDHLGISLGDRFKRTGMLDDLKEAIKSQRQAISLTPDDHPSKLGYLNNLGISLGNRFRRTEMLGDLEETIESQRQAMSLVPDDYPRKPVYLNNLGVSLRNRFGRTGILRNLEEAIESQRQAISLTPNDHPNKPMYLNNLGKSLRDRFRRTGTLSDLEEAIVNQRQVICLTPNDHPAKPGHLGNLGISLGNRFGRTGMLSDLEEAIESQRQAISLTPEDHPGKSLHLMDLGVSLRNRFRRTGTLSDLEEAIESQRQAISLTPDDHPGKPLHLVNLGVSLGDRFRRTGMLSDLEQAIENQRQAISLTPDDHPSKPGRLVDLGASLRNRFGHTGTLSDLEEAIVIQRQAISLVPDDHPAKPGYLNNLGVSLQSRFDPTGMPGDLEEAIKSQRQAISLTPDDHPSRPGYLNDLGVSLAKRFGHTGMLSDLEDAINSKQQALLLIPNGHAKEPMYLYNLGKSLESRFQRTGLQDHLDKAISTFQLATTSNVGLPLLRCQAFQRWARLEAKRDLPSALIAYGQAIDLLPQVAWIGDPIATRHSQLTKLGDISREAAAFALDIDHPDLALEWLEQGRSVVWNQLLLLRPSVDHLHQIHPDLCAEFTRISRELQSAVTRGHNSITSDGVQNPILLEEETQYHHRLAEKWDLLVQEIRSLPNFHDFLLPKKVSALMGAASSGPVVVINVHERRCDALVLDQRREQVVHIPLNKFHYDDLKKMHISLQQYLANPYRASRWENRAGRPAQAVAGSLVIVEILEQIYSKVVYPILQGLDMMTVKSESSDLPRIWWCPTGPLTFFPLHAACCATGTKTDGAFSYVVSSYTPTINALLEARSAKHQSFNRLAGIAMTNTPGQSSLLGAGMEIGKMKKLFAADSRWSFETLQNEQATGEKVLIQMANSSWVHFACHAVQDKKEPTKSGFCLHDRRLTILDIVAKPSSYADFAFLSACQTAAGDENASDEAVHITGAMLGAGYRNVVGTMWAIPDNAASMVATKVYGVLLSGGEPDSSRAALALHEAVRAMRESDHDSYSSWVPFVHYGA